MSAIDVSAVMDAIGTELINAGLAVRIFPWPADAVEFPCAVVGYPEITFDAVFQDGSDHAVFPVWYACGDAQDRATRDNLSTLISAVKTALDGDLSGAVQTARVMSCKVTPRTITRDNPVGGKGSVNYLAAEFELDVYT